MGNVDCIDSSLGGVNTSTKYTLNYLLISALCGILFVGIIATQMKSSTDKDYAQIINEQKAKQAYAMRADLSY